jgi:hypothetical protein
LIPVQPIGYYICTGKNPLQNTKNPGLIHFFKQHWEGLMINHLPINFIILASFSGGLEIMSILLHCLISIKVYFFKRRASQLSPSWAQMSVFNMIDKR